MEFRFNPESHQYFIGERRVVSVTQVLGDLIPGWHASDWHMERGRVVHAAAAFVAQGIDFDCDERISGQVAALRKFFAEVEPVVCAVEKQVYSQKYMYAGTLDLLTRKPQGLQPMIVDFKASLSASVPYQCAAYALAHEEMGMARIPVGLGCGVQISENGSYKMSEVYELRRYKQEWLGLLTAYNVRRKCKVKETQQEGGKTE